MTWFTTRFRVILRFRQNHVRVRFLPYHRARLFYREQLGTF
jgi:hypothetical protein